MTNRKWRKPCIQRAPARHSWAKWVVTHPKMAGFKLGHWFTYHTTLQDAFRAARDTHVNS